MARAIIEQDYGDPGDGGGNPTPSDPTAPAGSVNNPTTTSPNSKLAKMVFGTSTLFTADEIKAAGGPWPKFKLRVTCLNNSGRSEIVEYTYSDVEQAPTSPTRFSVADGVGSSNVTWRNPIDNNYGWTRLYRSNTTNFADAVQIGGDIVGGLGAVQTVNDAPGATGTYYYFVRSFSNSGLASPVVGPDSAVIS